MATKSCSRCGQEKPLDEFYRQEGGAFGRRGACKECFKVMARIQFEIEQEPGLEGG